MSDVIITTKGKHNKGKKNRKYGRNKESCARYRAEGRREKNKARKKAIRERKELRRKEKQAEKNDI